jgi:hypothetical protein
VAKHKYQVFAGHQFLLTLKGNLTICQLIGQHSVQVVQIQWLLSKIGVLSLSKPQNLLEKLLKIFFRYKNSVCVTVGCYLPHSPNNSNRGHFTSDGNTGACALTKVSYA